MNITEAQPAQPCDPLDPKQGDTASECLQNSSQHLLLQTNINRIRKERVSHYHLEVGSTIQQQTAYSPFKPVDLFHVGT